MPTYQYACTACDERLEAVQSFTDAPLVECPACGGTLRKVFSAVGVVFKGSGFYKNDSRGATGSQDAAKTETKADTGSGGEKTGGEKTGDKAAATSSSSSASSSSSSSTPASSTPASKSA